MEPHVLSLIPDYVLGLADDRDRQRLEIHVGQCAACRQALERERSVEQLVRQTLQIATQPSPMQLQALRPVYVPRVAARATWAMRQLAPVMVLLAIMVGTLALQTTRLAGGLGVGAPGFTRMNTPTMTSTSTPTATIAGLTRPASAPVLHQTVNTQPTIAPQPATRANQSRPVATPVAAAMSQMARGSATN